MPIPETECGKLSASEITVREALRKLRTAEQQLIAALRVVRETRQAVLLIEEAKRKER